MSEYDLDEYLGELLDFGPADSLPGEQSDRDEYEPHGWRWAEEAWERAKTMSSSRDEMNYYQATAYITLGVSGHFPDRAAFDRAVIELYENGDGDRPAGLSVDRSHIELEHDDDSDLEDDDGPQR